VIEQQVLEGLDGLQWLGSGEEASRVLGISQATVSRYSQRALKLFGLGMERQEGEWQLTGDATFLQLERRVQFRRAMRRAVTNTMRIGAEGIKVRVSGRLNGAEIARSEWYREGRVPLHTFRADIDYGLAEAKTTYGVIGVKVWVFRGEVREGAETTTTTEPAEAARPQQPQA